MVTYFRKQHQPRGFNNDGVPFLWERISLWTSFISLSFFSLLSGWLLYTTGCC